MEPRNTRVVFSKALYKIPPILMENLAQVSCQENPSENSFSYAKIWDLP